VSNRNGAQIIKRKDGARDRCSLVGMWGALIVAFVSIYIHRIKTRLQESSCDGSVRVLVSYSTSHNDPHGSTDPKRAGTGPNAIEHD
jgi:hypothetical protein